MSHDEGKPAEEMPPVWILSSGRCLTRLVLRRADGAGRWRLICLTTTNSAAAQRHSGNKSHPTKAWNALAEHLASRLPQDRSAKNRDDFSTRFVRSAEQWLILSLERAGRRERIILFAGKKWRGQGVTSARPSSSKSQRWKKAEEWIHKGIAAD